MSLLTQRGGGTRMCFNSAKSYQISFFGDAVRTVAAGGRYDGPVKGQVNYAGGCHRGSRTRSSSGSTCGTATTTTTWGSTTGPSTTRTFLVSFRRGLFFSLALFDLTDRDTTRSCVL